MDKNYSNLLEQINKIDELINKENNKGKEKEGEMNKKRKQIVIKMKNDYLP
jgi:hypothetical protein